MDQPAILQLAHADFGRIRAHLLPPRTRYEEAVFLFARADVDGLFTPIEWRAIPPEGFLHRSPCYLELTDETRAALIKRAHDLKASMIELHSHPFDRVAAFSLSDRSGFLEFVPHVLWRLGGRPYAAVVFTPTSFDSLAWFTDVTHARLLHIRLDDEKILWPTGETLQSWSESDET